MYVIQDYTDWAEDTKVLLSGANEKEWITNGQMAGLFKYAKVNNGTVSGEYWSESMASDLIDLAGMDCMVANAGERNGRLGSFCYDIKVTHGYFTEVVDLLTDSSVRRGRFDPNEILDVIPEEIHYDLFKMFIIDFIIGNNDRHTGNFAILTRTEGLAPLYDNGSSLACRISKENAEQMKKDSMQYESFLFSKVKSSAVIGLGRELKSVDLLRFYKGHDSFDWALKEILERMELGRINIVLRLFNDIVEDWRLEFIERMLNDRLNYLKEGFRW